MKDSVLFSGAADFFPRTTVHFILGLQDVNQGPTGGLAFYDYITSRKRIQFVDTGHSVHQNGAGRQAIKNAVEYWTRPFVGDVDYDSVVSGGYDTGYISAHLTENVCTVHGYPNLNPDVNNDGVVDSSDAAIESTVRGCPGSCHDVYLRMCDAELVEACGLLYFAPEDASSCENDHATFGTPTTCGPGTSC